METIYRKAYSCKSVLCYKIDWIILIQSQSNLPLKIDPTSRLSAFIHPTKKSFSTQTQIPNDLLFSQQ